MGKIRMMIKRGRIDNAKKIWWDLRVHPFYPSIEFRICDMALTIEEIVGMAAILQCLVVKICKMHQQNINFRFYRRLMISENKWRASKDVIHANLIDFRKETSLAYSDLLEELLLFIDDVVIELDCRQEVEYSREILKMGTGADQQLQVFN
ncbi:hypothetical protein ACK1KB_09030 [Chryseobacterium sp. TY3]